ncbi:MAG: histidine kinase [Clostridium butyricum]|nr:histidine kinase [Clostridium butyricum]
MKINKKVKILLIFVLIFSFAIPDVSYADINKNIRFNNITVEEGLSQSTVNKIYQDSRGYIWIGTNDGLDRYNGNKFNHYKSSKYNKNSIINNSIIDITEDKNGDMWISTIDGISRINADTDKIKNYYQKKENGNLSDNSVYDILVDEDNRIFAATENGLNIYNEKEDTFYRILDKEDYLPSQYIYSIEQDSHGFIWVSTDKGLVKLDKDLNLIKTYEDIIGECDVYGIYDDLKGYIWVCTFNKGLFRINLENESIENYRNTEEKTSISSNNVKDVVVDFKGRLWAATENGLCSFDYEKEEFTSYNHELYEKDSLIDDKTCCLLKDSSGLIWVGAYSGISVFNPNSNFSHFKSKPNDSMNSLSGNMVQGIYKDDYGILWVGTSENGLNIIDKDAVKHLNKENSNIISNSIQDIAGSKDYVFIGTKDGLSVLNRNSDDNYKINNYTEKDGLPSNIIKSLFVDSKNNLWIGTNKGLAVLNMKSGQITDVTYIFEKAGVTDKFVRAIYEDSEGNYYIGCFLHGGLIKIDSNLEEYKVYHNDEDDNQSISNNSIRYITQDLNGNILVGTSYGLNILDSATDKFKHYTEDDGLINNTVYGILVDKNNDIWMSTNGGISKFSIDKQTFNNFTIGDGLQSNEFNGRACFNSNDGYLYFGGINGFNSINIDNVEVCTFQPKVMFDSFEVNGISKKYIPNMKLKYNENNIKINFFSNDYKNAKTTKYYYKLNDEDKWNVTDHNSLTLANLAPGDYTLVITTMMEDEVVSEVSSVSFTIKAPIWRSNYAICIYCILIVLFIYISCNKFKTLDKLVDIRTSELRKEMDKNEELFNQVLKLEKNKNNYFINLSHELRTPLNILSSINQLIKSFGKNDTVLTNERLMYYMDIMSRNCNRLLNLINNLIDYNKIENNNYVVVKHGIDIVYLVEETVLDMKDYIEGKGIDVIFDTDVEEKLIQCNKLDIERCIINLVNNAAKFTDKGGLIQVSLYDLNDKVKIVVKDNGIGISEENQKIIFDRFHQVVDRNSEQKGGSGLGLTITKHLIVLHGGQIFVKSKVGEGSEFTIILPV